MVEQNNNIITHIQHLGKTNKLQDISKTQNPSTRSFQGTRFEDRIVCKIGIVLSTSITTTTTSSGPLPKSKARQGPGKVRVGFVFKEDL